MKRVIFYGRYLELEDDGKILPVDETKATQVEKFSLATSKDLIISIVLIATFLLLIGLFCFATVPPVLSLKPFAISALVAVVLFLLGYMVFSAIENANDPANPRIIKQLMDAGYTEYFVTPEELMDSTGEEDYTEVVLGTCVWKKDDQTIPETTDAIKRWRKEQKKK